MVAGAHEHRFGAHVDAVRVGDVHPAVEFEDRHPLAVDGDLELFRGFVGVERVAPVADQGAGGFVVEGDAEDVFTVGREVVFDAEAAARSVGRALDPLGLRSPAGDLVLGLARGGGCVAQRQPCDVAGPVQVGFEQGGREHLGVGDVVEVRALGVEREVFAGVDVEIEQVLDRAFVLGAVQALEGAGAGIGVRRESGVHAILERGDQQLERVAGRAGHPRWGHHPRAQLEDHPLHGLGARGQVVDVEAGEGHVAGEERVVVADLAVALNDFGERGCGQVSGAGGASGRIRGEGVTGRPRRVAGQDRRDPVIRIAGVEHRSGGGGIARAGRRNPDACHNRDRCECFHAVVPTSLLGPPVRGGCGMARESSAGGQVARGHTPSPTETTPQP